MNELQLTVMELIINWIKQEKSPVPRQTILVALSNGQVKEFNVSHAIDSLIKKGYIRKATVTTRTTSYVQLRGL